MLELLRRAMEEKIPIDIYFRIGIDEQPSRCLLYYSAFLVTEINEQDQTFSGFTIQERRKKLGDRILTTDSIRLICNIYSPYF